MIEYKVTYRFVKSGKVGEIYADIHEIDDVLNIKNKNPDIEIISVVEVEENYDCD